MSGEKRYWLTAVVIAVGLAAVHILAWFGGPVVVSFWTLPVIAGTASLLTAIFLHTRFKIKK